MLFTGKGDKGTTGLFGTGERLPKHSPIYDALGTLDELNSFLGICRVAFAHRDDLELDVSDIICNIQECLFIAQAELAGADKSINISKVREMEKLIMNIEAYVGDPHRFLIPGATDSGALLDFARAVSRRAERAVLKVHNIREISSGTRAYLNRLSSLLYALVRYAVKSEGADEISPAY